MKKVLVVALFLAGGLVMAQDQQPTLPAVDDRSVAAVGTDLDGLERSMQVRIDELKAAIDDMASDVESELGDSELGRSISTADELVERGCGVARELIHMLLRDAGSLEFKMSQPHPDSVQKMLEEDRVLLASQVEQARELAGRLDAVSTRIGELRAEYAGVMEYADDLVRQGKRDRAIRCLQAFVEAAEATVGAISTEMEKKHGSTP